MRGYRLRTNIRLRRAVISRLLCPAVVPKDEISREFSIDFDKYFEEELRRLEPFREDGLVLLDRGQICATWLGRIFIRNLAMIFDPYLEKQQLTAKPLFSKTL
jgi:oxygen-independent coproporphyrinogen-3 oxidase